MGKDNVKDAHRVQFPAWRYISGETLVTPSPEALTIPSTAHIIEISAEGGAVYWAGGGVPASALSPGYVPEDCIEIIGPVCDFTIDSGFSVFSAGTAHITYWREV